MKISIEANDKCSGRVARVYFQGDGAVLPSPKELFSAACVARRLLEGKVEIENGTDLKFELFNIALDREGPGK